MFLNIYNILLGLWGVATSILPVGVYIYWHYKNKKKGRCCSYVWNVFFVVLMIFGGCYLLATFGLVIVTLYASVLVYGSYTNLITTVNQTSLCNPTVYYSSFVSVTLIYFVALTVSIIVATACFYSFLHS